MIEYNLQLNNCSKKEVIYTKERGEIRQIELGSQDFFAAFLSGDSSYLTTQIPENVVQAFCSGCDNLQADGICGIVGFNDQARYVAREYCDWASRNGVRGRMTIEGFINSSDIRYQE